MDPTTLVHAATTFALFGLIWTIQLVHYPCFVHIEATRWPAFHRMHSRNITFIVFPLMLTELLTAIQLFMESQKLPHFIFIICSILTWLATIFIFIPQHNAVVHRPIPEKLIRLSRLNWIRTVLWSIAAAATLTELLG